MDKLKEIAKIDFHFGWTQRILLVLAIILGLQLDVAMDSYYADVQTFVNENPSVMSIENQAELISYFEAINPEMIETRNEIRGDVLLFFAIALLGVPKPTLKSLNKTYIAMKT